MPFNIKTTTFILPMLTLVLLGAGCSQTDTVPIESDTKMAEPEVAEVLEPQSPEPVGQPVELYEVNNELFGFQLTLPTQLQSKPYADADFDKPNRNTIAVYSVSDSITDSGTMTLGFWTVDPGEYLIEDYSTIPVGTEGYWGVSYSEEPEFYATVEGRDFYQMELYDDGWVVTHIWTKIGEKYFVFRFLDSPIVEIEDYIRGIVESFRA